LAATEEKSLLYKLEPVIAKWPAITKPEGHVHFRTKLIWTFTCLMAYFVLSNVLVYGLSQDSLDAFAAFRAILAGEAGSLVHMGIMPIVTASIIMQLFTGAKIIKLDLQNGEDKRIYQGTQKILVVVMIFVEAIPQVFGFLIPSEAFVASFGEGWARAAIIGQIALGSYLVFLMDEVVSKWGIGSGISLFIVASVSQSLFTGFLSWIPPDGRGSMYSIQNPPAGVVPKTLYLLNQMSTHELVNQGGFEQILLAPPNPIIALLATVIVFVVVVYAESSRIELPLSHGKVRGARGRYPIRLLYASVIPVILAGALLANINLMGLLLYTGPLRELPLLGYGWLSVNAPQYAGWFGTYMAGTTEPVSGIAYYFSLVDGVADWLLPLLGSQYGAVTL
jgi:preprotein translocase subunit SecY